MAGRVPSEESDEEFQEAQHARLKDSYRSAREDQREFTIEKKDQLRTQSKTLRQLTRERDELEKVYCLAESLDNQRHDEQRTKKLQELIQLKDEIQSEIQQEKAISAELDEKLRDYEKKLRRKQIEMGGANVAIAFTANVQKQERILENRLDMTLKRFNATLAANSVLREEIDTLRNERERYESLFSKSQRELRYLRADLVECIEQSVAAYEQRKECNTKAILLQNKAEIDKGTAEAEMRELERQISHDRKLRDFMKLKAQERQDDEDLVKYRKRKEAETIEKRRKDKEEHSVEAYETKFKQIQEISGEPNLDKLVEKFIEVEDKNFALFNYINELNNQIELYQEQYLDVQKDIHRFEEQGVELEVQRREKLGELEEKRAQATVLAAEYEEKTRETRKTLDQCRAGIQSLFKKIGCDRQQIDHLLQSHEGVTEENMLKYMGIIEERANELLTAQATIQAKEQNIPLRERAPNLIGDGPSGPAPRVQIHLPNTLVDERRDLEDREEKTEEELKPLTRDELKQRAVDHVKSLERKALQEQSRRNGTASGSTREKSLTRPSRSGGADSRRTPGSRGR